MIGKLPLSDIAEVLGGITDLRKDKPIEEGTLIADDQLQVAPGQRTRIVWKEGCGVTDGIVRPQDQKGMQPRCMDQLLRDIRQGTSDDSLRLSHICQATIGVIGNIHQFC